MAKQTVTYSCGHDAQVFLSGPYAARERKIAWAEREGVCPTCYTGRKHAANKALGPVLTSEMGTNADGKRDRVVVTIANAYDIRKTLKARGYKWDPNTRTWGREWVVAEMTPAAAATIIRAAEAEIADLVAQSVIADDATHIKRTAEMARIVTRLIQ